MALVPFISVHGGTVVLSLDVDAARTVVGWSLVNNSGRQVEVDLTIRGNRLTTVPFAPGAHAGTVPNNRRWNLDDETVARSYGVAVRW